MTNYILFNQTLKSVSGFQTDEAVLYISNYNINTNYNAENATPTRTANINYSLFKSQTDKVNGEQAFQIKSSVSDTTALPFNLFFNDIEAGDFTIVKMYQKVLDKLVDLGFDVELKEVA